eukprot:gene11013-7656_t
MPTFPANIYIYIFLCSPFFFYYYYHICYWLTSYPFLIYVHLCYIIVKKGDEEITRWLNKTRDLRLLLWIQLIKLLSLCTLYIFLLVVVSLQLKREKKDARTSRVIGEKSKSSLGRLLRVHVTGTLTQCTHNDGRMEAIHSPALIHASPAEGHNTTALADPELGPSQHGEHEAQDHHQEEVPPAGQSTTTELPHGDIDDEPVLAADHDGAPQHVLALVSQSVLHATRPMENLPPLHAQELATIGRCVTLSTPSTTIGDTLEVMVYEGLVGSVTHDCITLLHCHRFVPSEHETFRQYGSASEEQNVVEDNAFHHMEEEGEITSSAAVPPLLHITSSNSSEQEEECAPTSQHRPPPGEASKVRELYTMGPLPVVSFNRTKIHDVKFAVNPPASFYSIFSDPEKRLMDMQYLRMFVRRYLVHTSQGNNPGGIPLQAFVAVRANCPTIEAALLEKVAKEELMALVKADAKIKSNRTIHPGDLRTVDRATSLREVLVQTRIPKLTSHVSMLMGAITMFTIGFSVLFLYGFREPRFMFVFFNQYWEALFIGALLCIPEVIVTAVHAKFMTPPFASEIKFCVQRGCFCAVSLSLCICSICSLVGAVKPQTLKHYYHDANTLDKCAYFALYECSGFETPAVDVAMNVCMLKASDFNPEMPCRLYMKHKVDTVLYPVIFFYSVLCDGPDASFSLIIFLFVASTSDTNADSNVLEANVFLCRTGGVKMKSASFYVQHFPISTLYSAEDGFHEEDLVHSRCMKYIPPIFQDIRKERRLLPEKKELLPGSRGVGALRLVFLFSSLHCLPSLYFSFSAYLFFFFFFFPLVVPGKLISSASVNRLSQNSCIIFVYQPPSFALTILSQWSGIRLINSNSIERMDNEGAAKCVCDVTRPMDNLPPLHAQELATIGRNVIFTASSSVATDHAEMMYSGLISFIGSNCITLLHCHRFVPSDRELYLQYCSASEKQNVEEDNAFQDMAGEAVDVLDLDNSRIARENYSFDAEVSPPPSANIDAPDGHRRIDAATQTSLNGLGEESRTPPPGEPSKVRELYTMGPLPVVSFNRTKIHDVKFAVNPPASFYSIFSDPEKRLMDMQYLRMFVRRYLVHTSQGNNPGGIPLQAFVAVRANCPTIEAALLEKVAKEELMALVKADAEMESDNTALLQRRPGDLGTIDYNGDWMRRLMVETGIPRWTDFFGCSLAGAAIGCIVVTIICVYVPFGMPGLAYGYIKRKLNALWLVPLLSIPTGLLSVHHSAVMCPPLFRQRELSLLRACFSASSIVLCVVAWVVLVSTRSRSTLQDYYNYGATDREKCIFFASQQCSGLREPDPMFALASCGLNVAEWYDPTRVCEPRLSNSMSGVFWGLFWSFFLLLAYLVVDFILLIAMVVTIRRIDQRRVQQQQRIRDV